MADPTPVEVAGGLSASATTTVNFTARAAGTLLLLSVAGDDYRVASGTGTPESSGWALLDARQGNLGCYAWWKIASGSETSVQYRIGSNARSAYSLVALDNIAVSPLGVQNGNASAITTSLPRPQATASVTPAAGERWCVVATAGTTGNVNGGPYTWTGYTKLSERWNTAGYRPGVSVGVTTVDGGSAVNGTVNFTASTEQFMSIVAAWKVAPDVGGGSTPVTATRSTSWRVRAAALVSRAASWRVRAAVTTARATAYDVRTQVSTQRSTSWNVDGTITQVTATRAATWDTRASVTATRATTWDVRTPVTASRLTTWDVRTPVTTSRATSWGTCTIVTATRSTSWDTAASINRTLATSWDVRSQATTQRSTSWNVDSTRITVTSSRTTSWRTLARPVASRTATWDVRSLVSNTRTATWDVRTAVARQRVTFWRTLAGPTVERDASWWTLAPVHAARSTSWRVDSDVVVEPLEVIVGAPITSRLTAGEPVRRYAVGDPVAGKSYAGPRQPPNYSVGG